MKQFEERGKSTVSYTYIDMDANGNEDDEMVVFVENSDGFYLILNYEKGKMYGFEEPYRGMSSLKKDGIHWASGGAEYTQIIRKKFLNDGSRVGNEVLAENDGGKYYIDGKGVSKKDFDEFIEKFHEKEDAEQYGLHHFHYLFFCLIHHNHHNDSAKVEKIPHYPKFCTLK